LENKKHEFEQLRHEFSKDISLLEGSKSEIKGRIVRTDAEKNILENTTQDEHNKVLDPVTYGRIEQQVKELYALGFADKAEGKMGNASAIQLLNEIEKLMDTFLQDFRISEEIDKDTVAAETTRIKKQLMIQRREEAKAREQALQEEKRRLKQEEKDKKQFVRVGKPAMARSEKKSFKKVKEVKKVLTDEQVDLKKYLEV